MKHTKTLLVSPLVLVSMFKGHGACAVTSDCPSDLEIVDASFDDWRDVIALKVQSESFDADGGYMDITFTRTAA